MHFDPETVLATLQASWSKETARQWTVDNPANGQCNVTAVLVFELFGGEILKTPLPGGDHFYNRVGGRRYDFTASQFDRPIAYADIPTGREDAERGIASAELTALRDAFLSRRRAAG